MTIRAKSFGMLKKCFVDFENYRWFIPYNFYWRKCFRWRWTRVNKDKVKRDIIKRNENKNTNVQIIKRSDSKELKAEITRLNDELKKKWGNA